MAIRYAHLAPQHRLAAVQRLCDTGAEQTAAIDTSVDTDATGAMTAESVGTLQPAKFVVVA